jgi:hypothetical protein
MTWKAVLLKRSALSLTKNVTRGEMRSSFTHVAFICDDVNIQRKLPQIFLVGERHISVADAERVHQELAPNIHVWRVKKAWVNSLLMQEIVKLLARTLDEHRSTHQCILYADVFRAHLTPPVLRCVTNASIFYCLVPSKLTWALQPCDTHMFATFKAFLSNFCVEHASERDDGKMTTVDILWCVAATIRQVLEARPWLAAFEHVGFSGGQLGVSQRTLRKLQMSCLPIVGSQLPSLLQFQAIFPSGANIPIVDLLGAIVRARRGSGGAHNADAATISHVVHVSIPSAHQPWTGRLRRAPSSRYATAARNPPEGWQTPPQAMAKSSASSSSRAPPV